MRSPEQSGLIQALIESAIAIAEADGNTIELRSSGWTEVREVHHMKYPMSDDVRSRLRLIEGLRHWSSQRTPHDEAGEGFTDDLNEVAIAFPIGR